MKQSKLEIYETTARVYQYHLEEEVQIVGAQTGAHEMKHILADSNFCFDGKRKAGSMNGFGYNDKNENFIILVDGIDEKQLGNLFLSIGASEAYVSYEDISEIEVIESEKTIVEQINLALHKIDADNVGTAYLGTKDNRIVAGTITTEDLIKEVQTPAVKPKTKKKSTRK